MARTKQTIEEMVNAAYEDEEVAAAVLAHVNELGTAEAILKGERTLPSEQDAKIWHGRSRAETAVIQQGSELADLRSQLAEVRESLARLQEKEAQDHAPHGSV